MPLANLRITQEQKDRALLVTLRYLCPCLFVFFNWTGLQGYCQFIQQLSMCLQAPATSSSGEQQSMQDLPSYPEDFVRRRLIVFIGIVIG